MCGLAGIHRRNGKPIPQANKLANELLLAIESRGRHGAGYLALMLNGKVQLEKQAVPASRFVKTRKLINRNAKTVLLHTRYATVGAPDDPRNAHPVASGKTAAVHNGTIYNATELFRVFGLERTAEVDSEIIPALIDHAGWANAADAIDLMDGGAATAVVNTEHPEELVLARTRSYPMVLLVTRDLVVFASTRMAIEMAWKRTYGSAPQGRWLSLDEWSVARVNGDITVTRIREKVVSRALPAPKLNGNAPRKRKKTAAKAAPKVTSKRASKRERERARRNGRGKVQTAVVAGRQVVTRNARVDRALDLVEVLQDADRAGNDDLFEIAIRDLMREGFSASEAYDMLDAPPTWADTAEAEWAEQMHLA